MYLAIRVPSEADRSWLPSGRSTWPRLAFWRALWHEWQPDRGGRLRAQGGRTWRDTPRLSWETGFRVMIFANF